MKKDNVRPNKRKKKKNRKKSSSQSNGKVYGRKINRGKSQKKKIPFPRIKPWKVITGAIVLGLLGMLYLKHVFATQELLREVQQAEREYNQAKRLHSNYRLTYDRMIGPAEIYDKAKGLGFVNGGPAEKVIEVEK
ncbi:hypothetical protein [Fodinibius sediminis]|nr:hypothetical protein [Fodinibius sediminis]